MNEWKFSLAVWQKNIQVELVPKSQNKNVVSYKIF